LPELLALVGYFLVAVLGAALVIGGSAVVRAVVQDPGGVGLSVLILGGWCLIMYLIGLIWIQISKGAITYSINLLRSSRLAPLNAARFR
jgi:hypothetical protein